MKLSKVMCLLSALVVFSMLLAACGSSGDSGGNASTESGGEAGQNAESVELTLAFLNFGNMADVASVQEEMNKITSAKINATVKLMPIDVAAWNQQTNLLLAGTEPLDLLVTSAFFNYSSQVAKGQLIALDELLAQYGPEIKNTMDPAIYNGTKIDGNIYGVPSLRDTAADYGMIMRKDIVEKHNIDLSAVKTFEDLEPIFELIKQKEPDLIPLVQGTQNQSIARMMYYPYVDILGDSLGGLLLNNQDLKIVNIFETDVFKEKVALANKWYKAGYIMQDAATTQELGTALVKAGKAFGYFANMKPGFENQESGITGTEMVAVRLSQPVSTSTAGNAFMMSIARNSKHPERATQMMNLLYTDADIMNLLTNGIEGKHYVINDDGTIKKPDPAPEADYQFNQWQIGNNFLTHIWQGTDPDLWNQMKEFNRSAVFSKALGFSFNAEPVKTEIAAATNVLNTYRVGLETGTLDPAVIDEFNDKLKAAGIEKIIAEKQKQIEAWAAAGAQ